ncbi:MAG: sodium/proton-translocating pyrophosphatase, partial [Ginsengibacter sp.]
PFKDTSGPSMNILIKLMSIVSLVIAPTLAKIHHDRIQNNRMEKMKSLMMMDSTMNHTGVTSINDVNSNNADTAPDDPQIKTLISELKKDGLIITSSDFSVSVKGGRLYINDKRQSAAINNKYKNIFAGKDDFSYEVKVNNK